MRPCRVGRCATSILTAATIISSCGGGDDDGGATAGATRSSVEAAADEPAADEPAPTTDAPSDDTSSATSPETSSDDDPPSGSAVACDGIFSTAEIEEFFAEPASLTEESNDSLGQLVCTWESVEDPDDLEDLAFKLLVVQFYSGSPIPAEQFFDPSIFESVTTIDGVGDLAYSAEDLGTSYYFFDDPVGGSLSYSEVDMGDVDAPKLHTAADVEQLFRTFHDRVT